MSRRRFLVVFDYGMGGLWASVFADSLDEIKQKAPKLEVVAHRPSWMTDEQLRDIESKDTFDINNIPPDWLKVLNE